LSQSVTNAPEGALTLKLKKLQSKTNYIIVENSPFKIHCFELWFLCIALLLNEIYLPMKFHVDALHSFKVMLRTKFKNENEQRAITPKVWFLELWSLCTALLLNAIYLWSFMLMPCIVLKLCSRQKKGMDEVTDESITICHPSGDIKMMSA